MNFIVYNDVIVTFSRYSKLSQSFIDNSIEWRRRLECVVQQQGGHIVHLI